MGNNFKQKFLVISLLFSTFIQQTHAEQSATDLAAIRQELDLLYSRKFEIGLVNDELFVAKIFSKERDEIKAIIDEEAFSIKQEGEAIEKQFIELNAEAPSLSAQEYQDRQDALNQSVRQLNIRQEELRFRAIKEQETLSILVMDILEKSARKYMLQKGNLIWILHDKSTILTFNEDKNCFISVVDITEQLIDIALQIKKSLVK